jgi:hypothetical protein
LRREGRGEDLMTVSAYLLGRSRHQPPGWLDDWLDSQIAKPDPDTELVFDATIRIGPSDRAADRLLHLLRAGYIPQDTLKRLGFGVWYEGISTGSFLGLVAAITQQPALRSLGLRMLANRLRHRPDDLANLTPLAADLVTDPQIIRNENVHFWAEIATLVLPTMTQSIARTLFSAHRLGDSWFLRHSYGSAVLAKCVGRDPPGTWEELRPILENVDVARLFTVGFPHGIIDRLPRTAVLEWAAQDVPRRPCLLARLATPDYSRDDTLAAQLASTYVDNSDVCSALFAEALSGMHWGSSADHWGAKALSMDEAANRTHLPGLRRWAIQSATSFREMAERDRVQEAEEKLYH